MSDKEVGGIYKEIINFFQKVNANGFFFLLFSFCSSYLAFK
jgi:hypothetical protein